MRHARPNSDTMGAQVRTLGTLGAPGTQCTLRTRSTLGTLGTLGILAILDTLGTYENITRRQPKKYCTCNTLACNDVH